MRKCPGGPLSTKVQTGMHCTAVTGYTALSLVVCVKTQQKHGSIKHHDKTKHYYNQLKNMIQSVESHVFLSVPKHYSANFDGHASVLTM